MTCLVGRSRLGRTWAWVAIVAGWLLVAATPLLATGEDVIEQSIEALGGREAWAAIDSMEIRGSLKTFSVARPFRLVRARPSNYRFEYLEDKRPVVLGFDGEQVWWENAWTLWSLVPWAAEPPPVYQDMIRSDAVFEPSFFAQPGSGVEVTYEGKTAFDLEPYHKITVRSPGGLEEEWYIDPVTYLPAIRISPGADIMMPWRQRTYLDDYREVGGIQLPYYAEIELGNRNRVMEVESVELGVETEPELFRMSRSKGMERLRSFAGPWHVELRQRLVDGLPWQESELDVEISTELFGAVLVEHATWISGGRVYRELRQYTYDRFKERYRVTTLDSFMQNLEVLEGTVDESGAIVVSNLGTGTAPPAPLPPEIEVPDPPPVLLRQETLSETEDGWLRQVEHSIDGGGSWALVVEWRYRRP